MVSSRESNIDLSEKRISQHLQDLIDAANNSVGTLKEQILEIYYQAVKEGFTPHQAKFLIKEFLLKQLLVIFIRYYRRNQKEHIFHKKIKKIVKIFHQVSKETY